MDKYDRNYNYALNRRNEDYGVYDPGHGSDYYYEPDLRLSERRSYGRYPDRASYDREWPRDKDRNVFERMGDRIRETWNDWTEGNRPEYERRYELTDFDRRSDYPGSHYPPEPRYGRYDERYEDRRDDGNIFERTGDAMRNFFRAPDSDNYREYEGRQDYGRTGFGSYAGTYGAYTGEHGLTGYNTGNEGRDNYTTDYDLHYREPGYDSSYRRDDLYRRRYDNAYRRRYNY